MSDDETGLAAVSPESQPPRSTEHFRRIISARKALVDAELELHAAVAAGREAGDSWALIGVALDKSEAEVLEQFGNAEQETASGDERARAEALRSAQQASAIVLADAALGRSRRKAK